MAVALGSIIDDLARLQTDVTALKASHESYIAREQKVGDVLERVRFLEVLQKVLRAKHVEQQAQIQDLCMHLTQVKGDVSPPHKGEKYADGDLKEQAVLERVTDLEMRQKASESELWELKFQFQNLCPQSAELKGVEFFEPSPLRQKASESELLELKSQFQNLRPQSAELKGAEHFELSVQSTKTSEEVIRDEGEQINNELDVQLRYRSSIFNQEQLLYEWNESLWDVSIFIGTTRMSMKSSLGVAACVVFYVVLCAGLVQQCATAMSQSNFDKDTRREFQYWRTTVAHDVELRNTVTGESLASGVCNQRMYIPHATLQLEAVQLLSDYLDTQNSSGLFTVRTGVCMCMLVLCVWLLILVHELGVCLDFLAACLSRPISPRTTFDLTDPSAAELVSVSRCRFIVIIAQFTARFLLLFFVGWYGCVFLIKETALTEMVLNSVAMEFLVKLDEMIFSALLPKQSRSTLDRIKPLTYRGFDRLQRCAFLLLIVGLVVFTKAILLDPFVVELQDNYDALCGALDESSLDFVMSVDSIGIPWAARTQRSHITSETYAQHAVSDVIRFGFPLRAEPLKPSQRANLGSFMQVGSALELERFLATLPEFQSPQAWNMINPEEMSEVVGWNEALVLGETDFGDEPGTVYNEFLKYLLGVSGQVRCADVPLHLCYEHGSVSKGFVMRKLCSSWCGCDSPTTGTVSNAFSRDASLGLQGCSAWVIRKGSFLNELEELPCADTNRNDVFVQWLQGIGDVQHASTGLLADRLLTSFQSGGCSAIAHFGLSSGGRLCVESSLPAICPLSCGCDKTVNWTAAHTWQVEYCPHSCGRQQHACLTIAVNHAGDTGIYGPFEGFQCIFPFKYKDKIYNSCTPDDWSGPWCAVTLKEGKLYQWGDCPPGC